MFKIFTNSSIQETKHENNMQSRNRKQADRQPGTIFPSPKTSKINIIDFIIIDFKLLPCKVSVLSLVLTSESCSVWSGSFDAVLTSSRKSGGDVVRSTGHNVKPHEPHS